MRLERGKLRVRHGPCKGKRAARQPDADDRGGMWHELRDYDGNEKDSAADDVGDHDRGGIERAKAAIEGGRGRMRLRGSGRLGRAAHQG